MYKLFSVFLVGGVYLNDVTHHFNPLLTYTLRYKKMTFLPNMTGTYTINQDRERQSISANLTADFTDVDSIVATFYRCNPEGIDCEYFQTWTFSDLCQKLKQKNQVWSSWYGATRPQMECPLNKVHYKLENAYFDLDSSLIIYPEATNYQWKVIQKFYMGDVFVGGYTVDCYYFGYRKRTKSIIKT